MNWLKKIMYGRYGSDTLSMGLIVAYILMALITFVSKMPVFQWIGYILILWSLYRSLSRNIYRRQRENQLFLKSSKPFATWFTRQINRIKHVKTHKYFKCPKCKQHLRAPRRRGSITITCPKCKSSFKMRT